MNLTAILQESQLIQVFVVDQANSYKNHACSLQIRYVSMVFPVHILFEPSDDTKSLVFSDQKLDQLNVQVKFVPELIQQVYLSFGSFQGARERYLLLAGNVVSNTAQEYTPTDFWTKRRTISDRILFKINHTLWHQGYVEAMQFEIMKVSGPPNWHNNGPLRTTET